MRVTVRDNDVGHALRILKRKLQKEGFFQELRRLGAYEKPSDKRRRKHGAAVKRQRKAERQREEREGF